MAKERRGEDVKDTYDLLAPAYDLLASPARIGKEVDLLEPRLRTEKVERILDAGCAIGSHSIELIRRGFRVTGIDISRAMVREARRRATAAGIKARFYRKDLLDAGSARGAPFDCLICLGNTISYADAERVRARVLSAFARAVRPGGYLVLQLRDLTTIRRTGHTFPVRSLRRGGREWILLRRQDPVSDGIRFQVNLLYRSSPENDWEIRSTESVLKVIGVTVWKQALRKAGFTSITAARDLAGTPRGRKGGSDLVLFARRGRESGVS